MLFAIAGYYKLATRHLIILGFGGLLLSLYLTAHSQAQRSTAGLMFFDMHPIMMMSLAIESIAYMTFWWSLGRGLRYIVDRCRAHTITAA